MLALISEHRRAITDTVIIILNFCLAMSASAMFAVAAKIGLKSFRAHAAACSILAFAFACAYMVLILFPSLAVGWGLFVRGFSLLAWIVVYNGTAIGLIVVQFRLSQKINEIEVPE